MGLVILEAPLCLQSKTLPKLLLEILFLDVSLLWPLAPHWVCKQQLFSFFYHLLCALLNILKLRFVSYLKKCYKILNNTANPCLLLICGSCKSDVGILKCIYWIYTYQSTYSDFAIWDIIWLGPRISRLRGGGTVQSLGFKVAMGSAGQISIWQCIIKVGLNLTFHMV